MIGGKLNLAKLTHVLMTKKGKDDKDVKCIVIPIQENNLFEDKEVNVYLDLIAFDLKNPKDNQTHLVKQSLPKEVREAMSEEERNNMPIIGSLNTDMGGGGGAADNAAGKGVVLTEDDNLPF